MVKQVSFMESYQKGFETEIYWLISRHIMGIYSTSHYSVHILVCFSGWIQIHARRQFSLYPMADMWNVSLVFLQ